MEFQDRAIQCIDCHQDFVFTAGEQEFYERKGFKEMPKRCKPCRESRKARRDGGSGGAGDYDGNRGAPAGGTRSFGGNGGREFFDAVCAACGAPARVPFRPAAGRPVYCRDCYSNRSPGNY
jgi:CxxC-x17-CxxC domain-containing protein